MQLRKCKLVLASASPRRRELLADMGYRFDVVPAGVDEAVDLRLEPGHQAEVVAEVKAEAVAAQAGEAIVLGADTIVACEGRVIGKAADEEEAREILGLLSSRRHAVITGICVLDTRSGEKQTAHAVTWVTMRPLTEAELDDYIASCHWQDKAGAYAIQAGGDRFIERIEGSETNVIGLPTELVAKMIPLSFKEYLDKLRRDTVERHRSLIVTADDAKLPTDLVSRFERPEAPLEVEIGPGKDDFVVRAAAESPATSFLAIERVRERVDKLCGKLKRAGVGNVRVFFGDVRYVAGRLLRPGQVSAFTVHHPDPYPKRRHAKHRLFQPGFAALLAGRMAPGASLIVSTDVEPYARQILDCLEATPGLVNQVAPGQMTTELPGHHQSVYERKRRAAGCVIYYLLFAKAPASEEHEP